MMYLNFVCQVDRLNSTVDGERSYTMSVVNFDCISSYEDEQDWGRQLAQAKHHVQFVSYAKSLDCVANHRDDVEELKQQNLFDAQKGGVQLWLPDGPTGHFYVTALSGKDGLGDVSKLADIGLQNEHLFLQFAVEVGFSKFEENSQIIRPVTFDMFCKGTRMYLPGMPQTGLVRRHAP
jgi:hypothetical protein